MKEYVIKKINDDNNNKSISEFINKGFDNYATQSGVSPSFKGFCFIAENSLGNIIGAITGKTLYNEVHISDLIVDENYRKSGLGSKLVSIVEDTYRDCGYNEITLTTFEFQAPEFYKKLGYNIEFTRENENPKLKKYFFKKNL